ncbi:MAG: DUF4340 domain-containing protein [Phycisphaerales bacterium]|nr:DUF4340 domain-containing protein [Phycisphaerales bacterium]
MNFKTSIALTFLLVVSMLGLLLVQGRKPQRTVKSGPDDATTAPGFEKSLFDKPIEDVKQVVCVRPDGAEWRFESEKKEGQAAAAWTLVKPVLGSVSAYMVDGIVNQLKNLKYNIRFAPGAADAVTPADAGLESPRVTVTVTGDGGDIVVKIGKAVSADKTYVRLGDGDIYVVNASLDSLIRERVEEYLDKELIKFDLGDVKTVTIGHRPEGGELVTYRLEKRDPDKWVFTEPFNADADDKAIEDALRALSRLRANDWAAAGAAEDLGRFGLTAPMLTCEITTEKELVVQTDADATKTDDAADAESDADADANADAEKPKPEPVKEIKTDRFQLAVSDRGPLGKDNQRYIRAGDRGGVATLIKATADKFTPDVEKWRNMKLLRQSVVAADRIKINRAAGESTDLIKGEDGKWSYADSGVAAESAAVTGLLHGIDAMKAAAFVDDADPADPALGFQSPQTELVFSLPGDDQPLRIQVGNPTDAESKRLFYVRINESRSVAKVRAAEAGVLQRPSLAFENHDVFVVAPGDLRTIDIARPNAVTGETEALTLQRETDATWKIIMPTAAGTDPVAATALTSALAALRAQSVASRDGAPSEFGLDKPAVHVAITYQGPATVNAGETDSADAQPPAPESLNVMLEIATHSNNVYAKRSDRPTIYQLPQASYDALIADFRTKDVWSFEIADVAGLTITTDDRTVRFDKTGNQWTYTPEADLPIDGPKVDALVQTLHDLKLERVVAYHAAELAAFRLDRPRHTVTLRTGDGTTMTLRVSAAACVATQPTGHCAVLEGSTDVFLLTGDAVSPMDVRVEDFESAAGS